MVHDGEKMKRSYQDYIHALQEERSKIQVFQRELPLCLDLVNQAIENCKQQLQCEEEKTTCNTEEEGPVLEEFIPLKRSCSSEEEDYEEEERCTITNKPNENMGKKKNVDWMRSVQLWNQTPDPPSKQKDVVIESKKGGGAFHPFHKEKTTPTISTTTTVTAAVPSSGPVLIPASSSTGDNSNKSKEDKDGQRKARRCWSPELHRRFLQALQQLGGSHAATPKQIRELMKVDGLTNDEVKSHLQKYRLHTRRPSQSIHSTGSTQPTQFLVVGGIWVPPPEYSAAAGTRGEASTATGGAPKGIYVPVAAQPQLALTSSSQQQQNEQQGSPSGSERRGSHSVGDDNTQSNSREAVSSSSDTTTASPAF